MQIIAIIAHDLTVRITTQDKNKNIQNGSLQESNATKAVRTNQITAISHVTKTWFIL